MECFKFCWGSGDIGGGHNLSLPHTPIGIGLSNQPMTPIGVTLHSLGLSVDQLQALRNIEGQRGSGNLLKKFENVKLFSQKNSVVYGLQLSSVD